MWSLCTLRGLAQNLEPGAYALGNSILREEAIYIEGCLEDMCICKKISTRLFLSEFDQESWAVKDGKDARVADIWIIGLIQY